MKKTVLELVQNILSAMDSDEVNSIGDTIEALQVAEVIKETYEDITVGVDIPGLEGLLELEGLQDLTRPNVLRMADNTEKIDWLRYRGSEVTYMAPEAFVQRQMSLYSGEEEYVILVDGIPVKNNEKPKFYTSFNDLELFFDGYDASIENTLHKSNTMGWGKKFLTFKLEDSFVPLLPANMFPRLLSEAKSVCFLNFKQVSNQKEEQRSRRQLIRLQNDLYRTGSISPFDRLPNYGRSPRRTISRRPS